MTQTTETNNGNQRVRNAEILAAIKHLEAKVDENHKDIRSALEHTTRCSERWEAHKETHAALDSRLSKTESSIGWKAALGAGLSALGISIGSWLKQ